MRLFVYVTLFILYEKIQIHAYKFTNDSLNETVSLNEFVKSDRWECSSLNKLFSTNFTTYDGFEKDCLNKLNNTNVLYFENLDEDLEQFKSVLGEKYNFVNLLFLPVNESAIQWDDFYVLNKRLYSNYGPKPSRIIVFEGYPNDCIVWWNKENEIWYMERECSNLTSEFIACKRSNSENYDDIDNNIELAQSDKRLESGQLPPEEVVGAGRKARSFKGRAFKNIGKAVSKTSHGLSKTVSSGLKLAKKGGKKVKFNKKIFGKIASGASSVSSGVVSVISGLSGPLSNVIGSIGNMLFTGSSQLLLAAGGVLAAVIGACCVGGSNFFGNQAGLPFTNPFARQNMFGGQFPTYSNAYGGYQNNIYDAPMYSTY